jgi:hypothetical protein
MDEAHPVLQEVMEAVQKPPRHIRQRAIEELIAAFCPEADEAAEIFDALTASLRVRYSDRADEALQQARFFRRALGEIV